MQKQKDGTPEILRCSALYFVPCTLYLVPCNLVILYNVLQNLFNQMHAVFADDVVFVHWVREVVHVFACFDHFLDQ